MDQRPLGLLTIHVKRGINLAIRDARSSDPYVVLSVGDQSLKTRVVKKNCNPTWNEEFSFAIKDPNVPIRLTVFDKDKFTGDDKMGDANIDIQAYLEALKMGMELLRLPNGCAIKRVEPNRQNCLSDESSIVWNNGKITQDMILRLNNVECGEVELMLEWHEGPGCRGLLPSS
ncbi:PREDICTED: protein C2-DOMAIN ABA-RELATED 10 [Tarenaya hassleriana]|uniref:protein C2-DOMAIN ABA-RELATED 10 n=1 Tax=Tarenaya hassleriana TaxID=28532 RepID=UPI00053C0E69|nr:PREDICTED: protein C2-DOMAIN ABA-RELATED 10 [Tarenaya hassleriana]